MKNICVFVYVCVYVTDNTYNFGVMPLVVKFILKNPQSFIFKKKNEIS